MVTNREKRVKTTKRSPNKTSGDHLSTLGVVLRDILSQIPQNTTWGPNYHKYIGKWPLLVQYLYNQAHRDR